MDDTDQRLVAALRADGRRSVSDLALDIGVSRATIRARMDRLVASGVIAGFTVQLTSDLQDHRVRALTLIEVEGKVANRVAARLRGLPAVQAIHTTNGRWDLIAEVVTEDLQSFDDVLRTIRLIDGIGVTESNLLLSTLKQPALRTA